MKGVIWLYEMNIIQNSIHTIVGDCRNCNGICSSSCLSQRYGSSVILDSKPCPSRNALIPYVYLVHGMIWIAIIGLLILKKKNAVKSKKYNGFYILGY